MESLNANPYFVEIRITGRLKYDVLNTMGTLTSRFHINTSKIVPHIRLLGPFRSSDENKLIEDFESVCSQTELMRYKIDGFTAFDSTGVLYLNIEDNEDIELFRLELIDNFRDYCKLNYWDFVTPYKLHLTLATDVSQKQIMATNAYMKSCKPFIYDYPLMRATLLKEGRILCEYDFVSSQLFDFRNPQAALDSRESTKQCYHMINAAKQLNPQIYFTADLHFGDERVINSCKRPFRDINMMDHALRSNWNSTVTPNDTIYFLGDLTHYESELETFEQYLSQLNGNIIFVQGNHDEHIVTDKISFVKYAEIDIDKYIPGCKLHMIHNPRNIPDYIRKNPNIWTLHGHAHNKTLNIYPYVSRATRYINVSTDVTHYRPVSLNEIVSLIKQEKSSQNDTIACAEQTDCGIGAS